MDVDDRRGSFHDSCAPVNCFLSIQGTVEADAKTVVFADRKELFTASCKNIYGSDAFAGFDRATFFA